MDRVEISHDIFKQNDANDARQLIRTKYKDMPELYFYYMGLTYCIEKKFDVAILYFRIAVKQGLNNYLLYYNLGTTYLENNDYINAEKYLKKSIELNRGSSKSYINLAYIYYKHGDIKRAYRIIKTGMLFSSDKELIDMEKKVFEKIK